MKQLMESKVDIGDSSDGLLTLTAILRLRDFLEMTVRNPLPQSNAETNPCGTWLSTFAKSQFQACISLVEEELLRVLPATMNTTEMAQVQSIFNSVLQFQLALLDSAYVRKQTDLELMQQSSSPWHPSNIIFTTDFDVTCTVVDSSDALVRAAEATAMKDAGDYLPGKMLEMYAEVLSRHAERVTDTFSTLESPKQSDSEAEATKHLSGRDVISDDLVPGMDPSLKPLFENITSSVVAFDEGSQDAPYNEAGLRKALTELGELEVLCNQEIMSARLLSGFTRQDIVAEAKQESLRGNCSRLLKQLVAIGTNIHVVSANWSRNLIVGGLPDLPKDKLFVHSNDLLFDDSGRSKGIIDMTVVDAFDKEHMLRALRKMYNYMDENDNRQKLTPQQQSVKRKMMVYLGDSYTDLLGLLEADLGIVIGDTLGLRRVISLYGIKLLPLVEASAYLSLARLNGTERSWRRSGILFEAQGWPDVEACLFGGLATSTIRPTPSSGESVKPSEGPQDQSMQQPRFDSNVVNPERCPPVSLKRVQVVG